MTLLNKYFIAQIRTGLISHWMSPKQYLELAQAELGKTNKAGFLPNVFTQVVKVLRNGDFMPSL